MAIKGSTVFVIMHNDYPKDVYEDPGEAETARAKLHDPDNGRFVRIYEFQIK